MSQTIGEGRIDISLKVDEDQLFFRIDNSIGDLAAAPAIPSRSTLGPGSPANGSSTPPSANGLGLRNVTRRLDLLYGSRYRLDKTETANHFHVTLKIPLS